MKSLASNYELLSIEMNFVGHGFWVNKNVNVDYAGDSIGCLLKSFRSLSRWSPPNSNQAPNTDCSRESVGSLPSMTRNAGPLSHADVTASGRRRSLFLTALVAFLLATLGLANADAAEHFHTGRRFEKQLEAPASIYWSDVRLRDGFRNLGATRRLGVWVDRRCDPSMQVSFKVASPRLKDCLWKLNREFEAIEVCWVDDLLYVGPRNAAVRFASVHELHKRQLMKLPADLRRRWRSKRRVDWPRLSDPVTLLDELESELQLTIQHKEKVLHDLWAATALPPLPLYQRLELLLAGFGLTFAVEKDGAARIVAMPASAKYSCKIEVPEGHQEAVQRYLQSQGEVLSGGNLSANWEVHQGVDRILNPPPASQDTSRIRYTLRAENQQLGVFVRSLCAQLGLECKFIDVPDEAEQQRITFRVEKAKLRTLIEKVLESTELDFQLSADQLTITKKGKAE